MQTSKAFNILNIIPNHLDTTHTGSSISSNKQNSKLSQPYLDTTFALVYNQMKRIFNSVKNLHTQLLIDQHRPYTSCGNAREVASNN